LILLPLSASGRESRCSSMPPIISSRICSYLVFVAVVIGFYRNALECSHNEDSLHLVCCQEHVCISWIVRMLAFTFGNFNLLSADYLHSVRIPSDYSRLRLAPANDLLHDPVSGLVGILAGLRFRHWLGLRLGSGGGFFFMAAVCHPPDTTASPKSSAGSLTQHGKAPTKCRFFASLRMTCHPAPVHFAQG